MTVRSVQPRPDAAGVLAKAAVRAAGFLDVSQAALAEVIGVSPSTLSRIARQQRINPADKPGQLAALFLRVYRSLDAMFGGNTEQCRLWFHSGNAHLGGTPADLVKTPQGLVHVADYLDAMRGQN